MQELQLHGLPKRRTARRNLIAVRTTSDLVKRDFNATGPNQLWVRSSVFVVHDCPYGRGGRHEETTAHL